MLSRVTHIHSAEIVSSGVCRLRNMQISDSIWRFVSLMVCNVVRMVGLEVYTQTLDRCQNANIYIFILLDHI